MAKYNQVSFIYYCPLVMWLKYTSGLCKFDHENVCMYENVCKLTSLHTMVTTMITQGKRLWFKEILKVIFVFSSFATLYIKSPLNDIQWLISLKTMFKKCLKGLNNLVFFHQQYKICH